jgi:hypothetical protein
MIRHYYGCWGIEVLAQLTKIEQEIDNTVIALDGYVEVEVRSPAFRRKFVTQRPDYDQVQISA